MQSRIQHPKFGEESRRQIESQQGESLPTGNRRAELTGRSEIVQDHQDIEKQCETVPSPENTEREEDLKPSEKHEMGESSPTSEQSHSQTSARGLQKLKVKLERQLTGSSASSHSLKAGSEGDLIVVGFRGSRDPSNPHNWSKFAKFCATINVAMVGMAIGIASSIDSTVLRPAAAEFGVSPVVESMATGLFLVGCGVGGLVAGPLSETFGRNPIYIVALVLFMIFLAASGAAPNIGAQLVFRFFAGFFGSTPLTCAGGSIADMWNPLERVYAFPIFANAAFTGPLIGPVVGGWIAGSNLSWRWVEWVSLIFSGLVLGLVTLFQPETYSGIILYRKAKYLRELTGDSRFVSPLEMQQESLLTRTRKSLYRPFLMTAQEPIIILIALYMSVVYIVLFTFLDGYEYIFAEIHGTSPGITGTCFLGIVVGVFLASFLVPFIYKMAKKQIAELKEQGVENPKLPPEFMLWYSMLGGSPAIPISLFWMGWTSDASISIWSPLAASVLFGFGILTVFTSSYQYIIDSYEVMAASGLACITVTRYLAAGGMVVAGIPFYENMGVHYTLTIMACLSALLTPLPYLFYVYGHKIRAMSKYAPNKPPPSPKPAVLCERCRSEI